MSLTLYYHPLSSFCWKVLIALYENGTPFTPVSVNLGDPDERAALLKLWPIGKFPVLRDDARDQTVPESSIIIDYLDRFYPGRIRFTPGDDDVAWQTRLQDRFYDLYVHLQTQAIVGNRLRPANAKDPHGVAEAKARLRTSYDMIEADMAARPWAMDRPKPVPFPTPLVEKKGSIARCRVASSMPMPVSPTCRQT